MPLSYSAEMETLALSDLLGRPVVDAGGAVGGRVREVAIAPQEDRSRVALLIVKTPSGERILPADQLAAIDQRGFRSTSAAPEWTTYTASEGLLLLERDLLDQQIIDINGRKVVRVNDAELVPERADSHVDLRVFGVDVGARGAVRRLFKGLVPSLALRPLLQRVRPKMIPWDFVDLIETDPARRVKLKISLEGLAKLHPADIADIVEELAPAEREAVFETLDEEVAAGALEEVNPKLQVSIVSSLDSDKAADIVEEMNPDAAADLLGDLSPEQSEQILQEMQPEEREEVSELLAHEENTAAGRMTTDFVVLQVVDKVLDAIAQLRQFEGALENVSHVWLTDADGKLVGSVPLSRLLLSPPETDLASLATEQVISCRENAPDREVAAQFDKYNLLSLPVVDDQGKLTGVITADDVITILRNRTP